ncbi:MAG: winged helix-turn-helix transcriptional regulator [Sciscionella sp.]
MHNAIPPHVEYNLTPLGQQAATKLRELMEQIEAMMPDVMAARERHDQGTKGE